LSDSGAGGGGGSSEHTFCVVTFALIVSKARILYTCWVSEALCYSISKSWFASNRARRIRNSSDRAQLTFGFRAVAVSYFVNTCVINECTCDRSGCRSGSLLANTTRHSLSRGARGRTGGTWVGNLAGVAPLASGRGCASGRRRRSATARRTREESKVASRLGSVTTGGGGVSTSGGRSVTSIFPITWSVVGGHAKSGLRKGW